MATDMATEFSYYLAMCSVVEPYGLASSEKLRSMDMHSKKDQEQGSMIMGKYLDHASGDIIFNRRLEPKKRQ